ncbi:small toxic polypeptide [Salmonella enterica]|nr:small toxic polypeptide [Salmonella enterica]EEN9709514.1 Hok/Gef family protein [Salmonella enterica]
MRRGYVLCLVVVCFTILMFVWMVRGSLCGLHIKQGSTELTAYLAYEVEQR